MIIEFEVENFLSIKNRMQLSMVAGIDKEMETTHCTAPGSAPDLKLLKSAVIYGANASGKSNLIKAILYMRDVVLTSSAGKKITEPTAFQPFKLDRQTIMEPGLFEMKFLVDGKIYIYGFRVDERRIVEEWLYFYPGKNKALLFKRRQKNAHRLDKEPGYGYKFGGFFKGEKHKIISLTRSNALYLTVGAQFAHPVLEKVHRWFSQFIVTAVTPNSSSPDHLTTRLMKSDPELKRRIVGFLQSADLGIQDVHVQQVHKEKTDRKTVDIKMVHRAVSEDEQVLARIDFDDESLGTRKMYQLAGPLFQILVHGGLLIIDELEDSLHLHMLKALLGEFFNCSRGAQIIFTAHNVQLLEEKLFRRDEIWFTEKSADGATELFSLADFRPKPRKDKSLKNGYLNGAFGALPIIGELLGE